MTKKRKKTILTKKQNKVNAIIMKKMEDDIQDARIKDELQLMADLTAYISQYVTVEQLPVTYRDFDDKWDGQEHPIRPVHEGPCIHRTLTLTEETMNIDGEIEETQYKIPVECNIDFTPYTPPVYEFPYVEEEAEKVGFWTRVKNWILGTNT